MKRKIIPILIVLFIIIIFNHTVLATYQRSGGETIDKIASELPEEIYVDSDSSLISYNSVDISQVKIYNYNNLKSEKNLGDNTVYHGKSDLINSNDDVKYLNSSNNQYYYLTESQFTKGLFGEEDGYLFYTFLLDKGVSEVKNVATVIYKGGVKIGNKKYDVRIDINSIKALENENTVCPIRILTGNRKYSDEKITFDSTNPEQIYNGKLVPALGVESINTNQKAKIEIDIDYYVLDENGKNINITGLFKISDLDQNQGFAIKDFKANKENTFIAEDFSDTSKICYKYENGQEDTFFYYKDNDGKGLDVCDIYLLLENREKTNMTFTFDNARAHSGITFEDIILKKYHKITTSVVNGNITADIKNIEDGEEKTIEYKPVEDDYYITSIKVDGKDVSVKDYESKYIFKNIVDDHTIEVVYSKKGSEENNDKDHTYTVTFDPKNDTTINNQIVKEGEKAKEPKTPEKEEYEFQYWYYIDENKKEVKYDFDTPVTHDIDLIAKWRDNTTADKNHANTGSEIFIIKITILIMTMMLITFGIRYKKMEI